MPSLSSQQALEWATDWLYTHWTELTTWYQSKTGESLTTVKYSIYHDNFPTLRFNSPAGEDIACILSLSWHRAIQECPILEELARLRFRAEYDEQAELMPATEVWTLTPTPHSRLEHYRATRQD